MVLINPKQVEWLVVYQPETNYKAVPLSEYFADWYRFFTHADIKYAESGSFKYYLTPKTYNSLPTEFKQLADATT
jgi:hypothetical protein